MAVSIDELFSHFGIDYFGPFKWNEKLNANYNGVYVITLSSDPKSKIATKYPFNICEKTFNSWMAEASELELDKVKIKSISDLKLYLEQFWNEDENILYIGASSSATNPLEKRINQFYVHKVGKKGPHTGGFWLKLLTCLESTSIYYAADIKPTQTEFKMIMKFIELSSGTSFYDLENVSMYFPFANLKVDLLKDHTLKRNTNKNTRKNKNIK